jgi:hypothetical protein
VLKTGWNCLPNNNGVVHFYVQVYNLASYARRKKYMARILAIRILRRIFELEKEKSLSNFIRVIE